MVTEQQSVYVSSLFLNVSALHSIFYGPLSPRHLINTMCNNWHAPLHIWEVPDLILGQKISHRDKDFFMS
jgi:hypothetical protein